MHNQDIPNKDLTSGNEIKSFLSKYQNRYQMIRISTGTSIFLIFFLCPIPCFCLLDRFIALDQSTRIWIWAVYLITTLLLAFHFLLKRILNHPDKLQTAFSVGDQNPHLHQSLASTIQLTELENISINKNVDRNRNELGISDGLIQAARKNTIKDIDRLKIGHLLPIHRVKTLGLIAFGVLAVQIVLCAIPDLEYSSLLKRFFNPFGNYDRVSGIHFEVTPGNVDAGDGETVRVDVKASDQALTRLGLYRGGEGMISQRFEMIRVKPGHFRFTLPNLRKDLTYFLAEDHHQTKKYFIRVRRRPRIEKFNIECQYPQYTGLSPKKEEKSDGHFSALTGSRIRLEVTMDIDVSKVYFVEESSSLKGSSANKMESDEKENVTVNKAEKSPKWIKKEMQVEGRTASLQINLTKTLNFQIVAYSKKLNQENTDRLTFRLEAIADHAPAVLIKNLSRKEVRDLHENQEIQYEIRDEFPIQAVRLLVQRTGYEDILRTLKPGELGQTMMIKGMTTISFAELNMKAGDEIMVSVEARDLKDQWGRSPKVVIQIPIASGDRNSIKIAHNFKNIKRSVEATLKQLDATHKSFEKMGKLLKGRPPKWMPRLESSYSQLRPSFDRLQQKAAYMLGLCVSESEKISDLLIKEELKPVQVLLINFETHIQGLDISQALVDIKEDFKGLGAGSAQEIQKNLKPWLGTVKKTLVYLQKLETKYWLRDLRKRTDQLVKAQQSILIEGAGISSINKLLPRQKMIIEELFQIDSASLKRSGVYPYNWRTKKQSIPNEMIQAVKESRLFQKVIKQKKYALSRSVKYLPYLTKVDFYYQNHLINLEYASIVDRQLLRAVNQKKSSITYQLQSIFDQLAELSDKIIEDPIDKVDELEILPLVIREARHLFGEIEKVNLQAKKESKNTKNFNRGNWKRSISQFVIQMELMREQVIKKAEHLGHQIFLTFNTKEPARPYLAKFRKSIMQLQKTLKKLVIQMGMLEEESRLAQLADRTRQILEQTLATEDLRIINREFNVLLVEIDRNSKSLQKKGEKETIVLLEKAKKGILGRGLRRGRQLSAPLVSAWLHLVNSSNQGTADGKKVRDEFQKSGPLQKETLLTLLNRLKERTTQNLQQLKGLKDDLPEGKTKLVPAQVEMLRRAMISQREINRNLKAMSLVFSAEMAASNIPIWITNFFKVFCNCMMDLRNFAR